MKVLISGATGFVGRRLGPILERAGHSLHVLSRNAEKAKAVFPQASAFPWEPAQSPPPADCFEGVNAVIHLAGESVVGAWTRQKRQSIRESRVLGTNHLVAGMRARHERPAVLVSASAIGYYGDRGEEELTEDSGPGEDFTAQVSATWEAEALKAETLGIRVAVIRIGIVLGPGAGALHAMLLPFKLGLGGPLGGGNQWWSWIQLDDLCEAQKFLLENEELRGVFNATSPQPTRQKHFAQTLAGLLNRPSFLPAPALAVKTMLGGFSSELLSSRRVLPRRLQAEGFSFRHGDLQSALRQSLLEPCTN